MQAREGERMRGRKPMINFRPLLFCALGLAFGIFLYIRCRFENLKASDFIFAGALVICAFRPPTLKRVAAVGVCVLVSACVGAGLIHLYTEKYFGGAEAGKYEIRGTVVSFSAENGYSTAILSHLAFDGERVAGKMQATFYTEEVRPGDVVVFTANVKKSGAPTEDYAEYLFANNVRYTASYASCEIEGVSSDLFYRLNASLYDLLHENMGKNEADVAYALLTGNSRGIDGELLQAMRTGGIAHIFAVSGLHIGILYAAVLLLFRPCGKYAFLPALAVALGYSAMCAFTVSSVRAVIMCGVLGFNRFFGRKTDLLQSTSFAAVIVLLSAPAEWLSAGFRLSFGACLGLALFSGTLTRALKRLPAFLRTYLAANFSVQLFTFPVLIEAFGYYSLWGTLLNFFLIPLLPALFLGLIVCVLLAAIVAPAAGIFLALPASMISALLYVFSVADFSMVLTGFSLGAGSVVWVTAAVFLSERVRMRMIFRVVSAGAFCLLFALCLIWQNSVFSGCRITVYGYRESNAALIRTDSASVLVIDGDLTLSRCEDFLARNYGGRLDAVVVLAEDELQAINVAVFLPADTVYARDEIATGLRETDVVFTETFTVGELVFRFESREKLMLLAEGVAVEIDFENAAALDADLFLEKGSGGLKFYLKDGIIRAI